jgi:hypothetical protein
MEIDLDPEIDEVVLEEGTVIDAGGGTIKEEDIVRHEPYDAEAPVILTVRVGRTESHEELDRNVPVQLLRWEKNQNRFTNIGWRNGEVVIMWEPDLDTHCGNVGHMDIGGERELLLEDHRTMSHSEGRARKPSQIRATRGLQLGLRRIVGRIHQGPSRGNH